MQPDLVDLYKRGSDWAIEKVAGASGKLDAKTPCDKWDVRTLLNHMLETQRYFLNTAQGKDASPPGPTPPETLSKDPLADFKAVRQELIDTYSQPGVLEKTGPSLGIAFSDLLIHSWDLARATGQDEVMPEGLAETNYQFIHGRFTDEQRKGIFGPAIEVGDNTPAQDRLLAYTGRNPVLT